MTTPVKASEITWNEGIARLAAIHGKTIEFRYLKQGEGDPATRRLKPESYLGKNGGSFLGPDPDRNNEPRRYRLEWITSDIKVID